MGSQILPNLSFFSLSQPVGWSSQVRCSRRPPLAGRALARQGMTRQKGLGRAGARGAAAAAGAGRPGLLGTKRGWGRQAAQGRTSSGLLHLALFPSPPRANRMNQRGSSAAGGPLAPCTRHPL